MLSRDGGYEMFACELQYFQAHLGTYVILRLHSGPAVRPVTPLHTLTPAANAREVKEAPVVSGGV